MQDVIDQDAQIKRILDNNGLQAGFGGTAAMWFLPSQPFHWLGLGVMKKHPLLWLLAIPFVAFAGWITYDLAFCMLDDGEILVSETRVMLLVPLLRLVTEFVPIKNKMLVGLIAALPFFAVGNILLACACGLITGNRPTWRWVLAGGLGIIPLRFMAGRFMPKWAFWGGQVGGLMGVNARILQFSVIYGLVCRKSRKEIEKLWIAVLDTRLREVFDSLYSHFYIAHTLVYGVIIFGVVVIYPLQDVLPRVSLGGFWDALPQIDPLLLVVIYFCWGAFTRFLLGVVFFTLLTTPDYTVTANSRWVRLIGMLGVVLATAALPLGFIYRVAGEPVHELNADRLSHNDVKRFFSRLEAGPGLFNGIVAPSMLHFCFDDSQVLKGIYTSNDGLFARKPELVASVDGTQLRYLPGATRKALACSVNGSLSE